MKRVIHAAIVSLIASQVLVIGQGNDVVRVLADVRQALGGVEKLTAVKTLSAEGTNTRPMPDGTSRANRFEMAIELPDKFVKKEVVWMIKDVAISRTSGFNGDVLIEMTDAPPQLGGGHIMVRPGSAGAVPGGPPISPEEAEQARNTALLSARREFTRLTLGMFASGFQVYPVEFSYAGQAESRDGKADVLEIKHADGFAARMFVDTTSHMPLMLSWMDKEPLMLAPMAMTSGGATVSAGGGAQVVRGGAGSMSTEERDRIVREQRERVKEAESKRKIVEYRVFYADYKVIDGVRLPTRIQRMIAGHPVDEIGLERIRVNPKLDPKTFAPTTESR